jgi:hypothetical protein
MIQSTPTDRRRFLQWSAAALAVAAAGCDGGDGDAKKVTTPPAESGNRTRLQKRADDAASKKTNPKAK